MFDLLKFIHIGSMFMATALAVGPSLVFYLIGRSSDRAVVARVFAYATGIGQAGAAFYGLGILSGVAAALTGAFDLTAHWLLAAYVLVALLAANGMLFERWSRRMTAAASDEAGAADLASLARERTPVVSLVVMIVITLAIVLVMITKPDLFG